MRISQIKLTKEDLENAHLLTPLTSVLKENQTQIYGSSILSSPTTKLNEIKEFKDNKDNKAHNLINSPSSNISCSQINSNLIINVPILMNQEINKADLSIDKNNLSNSQDEIISPNQQGPSSNISSSTNNIVNNISNFASMPLINNTGIVAGISNKDSLSLNPKDKEPGSLKILKKKDGFILASPRSSLLTSSSVGFTTIKPTKKTMTPKDLKISMKATGLPNNINCFDSKKKDKNEKNFRPSTEKFSKNLLKDQKEQSNDSKEQPSDFKDLTCDPKDQAINQSTPVNTSTESPYKTNDDIVDANDNILDFENSGNHASLFNTGSQLNNMIMSSQNMNEILDIAAYYKKEKGKINIWTYLFKNLNKAVSEIYTMCELENKLEFNNGVSDTLECALIDFKKLNRKFEIDNL